MRRGMIVLALGLGGCLLPARSGSDYFLTEGHADDGSFRCARREAVSLGYSVMRENDSTETLRAMRYLGRSGGSRLHGYLTVSITRDSAERLLAVSAERLAHRDQSRRRPRFPTPVPHPIPDPGPTPGPGPIPGTPPQFPPEVPRVASDEPVRLTPGEVATHARTVVRRCAVGGEIRAAE